MRKFIRTAYRLMNKGPLRALSLILALIVAGCLFWDPSRYAAHTSTLSVWQGILVIWAVCAGVIHGVGFQLRRTRWMAFFAPLLAQIALLFGLYWFWR
ncbi:cyd operon protein YbgE [Candidatus Pantoea deserta]|uniref:Cyd operon protein YbgE n=1 Tax=Candidatus Pantoea deserta TaxID=1869313 RepID=A0A3N4P520_9GAMM|nr:cyd operon protein YbgE [Pantoea deserta]RPE03753.1 cyd operon protein YbgE [Pantoea deserta]